MKSLYVVGTTADNKRLVLAKTKGAKFGSFSVPITPKLKKIFQEIEAGRVENLKGTGRGALAEDAKAAAASGETDAAESRFEGMTGLSRRGGSAARGADAKGRGKRGRGARQDAPQPVPEPEPEPPKPVERRPPINSKLAPAQIQALLRQGRSARSVAKDAGAPIEWVQRLLEPILLERMGIVEEMKRATFTKARRGPSVEPVGLSIIDNLRERGVAFPERASTRGWSAHRPDGREWRVRFTYDHRGGARTAQWEYDPATRSVVPLNALAAQLSWRPAPDEAGGGEAGHEGATRRPRRTSARKPAAKRAAPKRAGRKAPAKRPASRSSRSARRASTTRKPAPRKKPAAKKAAARRS